MGILCSVSIFLRKIKSGGATHHFHRNSLFNYAEQTSICRLPTHERTEILELHSPNVAFRLFTTDFQNEEGSDLAANLFKKGRAVIRQKRNPMRLRGTGHAGPFKNEGVPVPLRLGRNVTTP